jgi:hypothetical protein
VCHFVAGHVIVRLREEMSNVADGVARRRRRNVVLPTGLRSDLLTADGVRCRGQPARPAQIDPVIATGMAKDPDDRYATTVELADAARDAVTTPIPRPAQKMRTPSPSVATLAPPAPTSESTLLADPGPTTPAPVAQRQPADRPPPDTGTTPRAAWWRRQRRQVQLGMIAAVVLILATGAGITGYVLRQPSNVSLPSNTSQPSTTLPPTTPAPTTPPPAPPVAESALEGLLLSPDQINTAMGATGMTVTTAGTTTAMADDSAIVADKACLPVASPGEAPAYASSGWKGAARTATPEARRRPHKRWPVCGVVFLRA